jgi:RNA polymerase sigma factor (sigma-70 family)
LLSLLLIENFLNMKKINIALEKSIKADEGLPEGAIQHPMYEHLLIISWNDDPEYEAAAKKSFCEIYYALGQRLMAVCNKVCRGDTELAETIFNNTFAVLYDRAGTIAEALQRHSQSSQFDMKLMAYLFRIAQNEYRRSIAEEATLKKGLDFYDHEQMAGLADSISTDYDVEYESEKGKLLKAALQSLTEREQDILLTTMLYSAEDHYQPREVIKSLCKKWEILPDNLRQIKKRAIKKLKNILEQEGCTPISGSRDKMAS